MPQKSQNTTIQTELKHYNQFRSVITEAIRWLQITTDTGNKLKFEITVKEIDQQLLYFINIDLLNIEQQNYSDQYIINLPITPIIKSYLK